MKSLNSAPKATWTTNKRELEKKQKELRNKSTSLTDQEKLKAKLISRRLDKMGQKSDIRRDSQYPEYARSSPGERKNFYRQQKSKSK